jgi:hypothetical protein
MARSSMHQRYIRYVLADTLSLLPPFSFTNILQETTEPSVSFNPITMVFDWFRKPTEKDAGNGDAHPGQFAAFSIVLGIELTHIRDTN